MSIEGQREWKHQHVVDVLQRTGNITGSPVNSVFGTDEVYAYRSKITPHHEKPRSVSVIEKLSAFFSFLGRRVDNFFLTLVDLISVHCTYPYRCCLLTYK